MLKRILLRIQWPTLLYCAIGLWIALCASDIYYSEYNELLLPTGKVFPTTAISHQVAIETDATLMSISHLIKKGHESWGTIRKSRILTTFIVIIVSIWSILFIVCIQEYTRKKLERFVNIECFKQETNFNKETPKSTGIQVSYSSHFISTTLHYEENEKRSNHEWFSTMESSMHTASCIFKEEKNAQRNIYKNLEKHEKEISNNNNKEYNEYTIERLYNKRCTCEWKPVSQLIHYIYLSRSVHFQSTLLSQRYTISIFNTFSSLSVKYLLNSLLFKYSLKKNFFDSNNREEIIMDGLNICNWSHKNNKEVEKTKYFGKTNGYIISSSPAFQQFLANFMNIKYMQPTCV